MFVWNLFFAVLFSFGCKLTVIGLSNDDLGLRNDFRVKRHDLDYTTCLASFDIHQDKIIRTQDSRAMGAKYLNERDVPSREDCLRLCCETLDCDVFVFEEKNPGSCYLFQCGTPEDFKCKFTKHKNYTSAVLSSTRHMTELESQIKLTQHEHELTKLRKPEKILSSAATLVLPTESTTVPQGSKEIAQLIPTSSSTETENQNRHCSRYQFECRSSGECIAIYNACDGIPQCSDGSDEAPELGCPAQILTQAPLVKNNHALGESIAVIPSTVNHKVIPSNVVSGHNIVNIPQPSVNQQLPSTSLMEDNQLAMPVLSKQYKSNQWTPQMYGVSLDSQHSNPNYLSNNGQQSMIPMTMNQQLDVQQVQNQQIQDLQQPPPQLVNQAKIYGREGENLIYRPGSEALQWPSSYQPEQNNAGTYHSASNGNSQIFSHKGNGLVSQTDRYRHPMAHSVARGGGGNSGQYELLQNDFNRYNNYYENSPPYRGMPQGQLQNNWQMMHKPHDMNTMNNNLEEAMNMQGPNIPPSGPGQDYYYEESFRTRVQPQMIPQRLASHSQPMPNAEIPKEKIPVQQTETESVSHEPAVNSHSEGVSAKIAEVHHQASNITTEKPKEVNREHHHSSHRKMEQLTAELTLSESSFDSDIDQQNVSPRGAILSLTMGMCVTGIMLVLVGCRMRMVRRRLRRGSKSPYAHDADFLVNGMYL